MFMKNGAPKNSLRLSSHAVAASSRAAVEDDQREELLNSHNLMMGSRHSTKNRLYWKESDWWNEIDRNLRKAISNYEKIGNSKTTH